MTWPLHNVPGAWLTLCVPEVERTLQESARCGTPFLIVQGDGRVSLAGEKSKLQPDNRIDVNVHFEDGEDKKTYCVPQPRIVLETAFSQHRQAAKDKAWGYLCAGDDHTHAVIIVDLSYPVTLEKNFVAEVAVWVRSFTDEDGKPS
jgi:hypothetical protein